MASDAASPWTIGRILSVTQSVSGLVFSLFSLGHLTGHALIHFGLEPANAYLHDFRRYYQDSFVEPYLIFLPLGIHMVSSIFRAMLRPKDAKPDSERSLHRNLGWLLVPLTILHAFGARVGPVLKQGREMAAQKDFATFAVVANAVPAAVIVYVALLGTVGLIHSVSGVGYALQSLGIKLPKIPSSIRKALVWLAPVAMISTGLALAGIYGPFNFTAEQLALARQEHADKPFILEAINAKFGK